VVDDDDARRRSLVHALSGRGLRYLDVADAFAAMGALGRADFGALIATEGKRTLSLRGLCQLAHRRHPDIAIFVIQREGSDASAIPQILGTQVDVLPATLAADAVAAAVDAALVPRGPSDPSSAQPYATRVNAAPIAATAPVGGAGEASPVPARSAVAQPTAPPREIVPPRPAPMAPMAPRVLDMDVSSAWDAAVESPEGVAASPNPDGALLEGGFEGGSGPALLMGVFAQELTGRLVVKDGLAIGTLYFYRGEPVWAEDHAGDAGLHRRLVQKGKLKPDARIEAVAAGQLLGALMQNGLLTAAHVHEFMRELVRDGVIGVATATVGGYRFEEDRTFLDVAPLLRVNPFGLVLEARRKAVAPAELLALSSEIEGKYVVPGPGLGAASDKLAAFACGVRLGDVIDGKKTVREVLDVVRLDQLMGTLVMLALKDTRLVSFADEARSPDVGRVMVNDSQLTEMDSSELMLVDADLISDESTSAEESNAREEILGLYMRLKPLTSPRAVLGVGLDADAAEVEAALQARMEELDPNRIPDGSAQHLLTSRIEELRKKVLSAYEVLKLQGGPNPDGGNNPF
jgi:hypothetical protein